MTPVIKSQFYPLDFQELTRKISSLMGRFLSFPPKGGMNI